MEKGERWHRQVMNIVYDARSEECMIKDALLKGENKILPKVQY